MGSVSQCQNPRCKRFISQYRIRVHSNGRTYRCKRSKLRKYCNNKCQGIALRGSGNSYIMIRIDGQRVYLHHHVAETQVIHRKLLPGEIVHHKDEDIFNNHPSNLKVTKDRADHLREHNWYKDKRRDRRSSQQISVDIEEFGF